MSAQNVEELIVCGACLALGYAFMFTNINLGFGSHWSRATRRTLGGLAIVVGLANAIRALS